MRLPMSMMVAALVALGCSDSNSPAPVITGSWDGTLDVTSIGGSTCPLNASLTEASNSVTGTANLEMPCNVAAFNVTGTNNTDGVADSVEMILTGPATLTFHGNHDGSGEMTGVLNGGGCTDCPLSFTRTSTTP